MTEDGARLPWIVVRQEADGGSYRVGRYATRAEAEGVAGSLDTRGDRRLYRVESDESAPRG